MYIIKTIGHLNVLINDISLRFSSTTHPDGVPVSKEQYETSADLKRLIDSNLVTVIEAPDNTKETTVLSVDKNTDKSVVFVKDGYSIGVPENVFVVQPQEEVLDNTIKLVIENVENTNLSDAIEEVEIKIESASKEEVVKASETLDTDKVSRRNNNKRANK